MQQPLFSCRIKYGRPRSHLIFPDSTSGMLKAKESLQHTAWQMCMRAPQSTGTGAVVFQVARYPTRIMVRQPPSRLSSLGQLGAHFADPRNNLSLGNHSLCQQRVNQAVQEDFDLTDADKVFTHRRVREQAAAFHLSFQLDQSGSWLRGCHVHSFSRARELLTSQRRTLLTATCVRCPGIRGIVIASR